MWWTKPEEQRREGTSLRQDTKMKKEPSVMKILQWGSYMAILLALLFAIGGVCW
jgi:hypothetical protein